MESQPNAQYVWVWGTMPHSLSRVPHPTPLLTGGVLPANQPFACNIVQDSCRGHRSPSGNTVEFCESTCRFPNDTDRSVGSAISYPISPSIALVHTQPVLADVLMVGNIKSIHAGKGHIVALSSRGLALSWGSGPDTMEWDDYTWGQPVQTASSTHTTNSLHYHALTTPSPSPSSAPSPALVPMGSYGSHTARTLHTTSMSAEEGEKQSHLNASHSSPPPSPPPTAIAPVVQSISSPVVGDVENTSVVSASPRPSAHSPSSSSSSSSSSPLPDDAHHTHAHTLPAAPNSPQDAHAQPDTPTALPSTASLTHTHAASLSDANTHSIPRANTLPHSTSLTITSGTDTSATPSSSSAALPGTTASPSSTAIATSGTVESGNGHGTGNDIAVSSSSPSSPPPAIITPTLAHIHSHITTSATTTTVTTATTANNNNTHASSPHLALPSLPHPHRHQHPCRPQDQQRQPRSLSPRSAHARELVLSLLPSADIDADTPTGAARGRRLGTGAAMGIRVGMNAGEASYGQGHGQGSQYGSSSGYGSGSGSGGEDDLTHITPQTSSIPPVSSFGFFRPLAAVHHPLASLSVARDAMLATTASGRVLRWALRCAEEEEREEEEGVLYSPFGEDADGSGGGGDSGYNMETSGRHAHIHHTHAHHARTHDLDLAADTEMAGHDQSMRDTYSTALGDHTLPSTTASTAASADTITSLASATAASAAITNDGGAGAANNDTMVATSPASGITAAVDTKLPGDVVDTCTAVDSDTNDAIETPLTVAGALVYNLCDDNCDDNDDDDLDNHDDNTDNTPTNASVPHAHTEAQTPLSLVFSRHRALCLPQLHLATAAPASATSASAAVASTASAAKSVAESLVGSARRTSTSRVSVSKSVATDLPRRSIDATAHIAMARGSIDSTTSVASHGSLSRVSGGSMEPDAALPLSPQDTTSTTTSTSTSTDISVSEAALATPARRAASARAPLSPGASPRPHTPSHMHTHQHTQHHLQVLPARSSLASLPPHVTPRRFRRTAPLSPSSKHTLSSTSTPPTPLASPPRSSLLVTPRTSISSPPRALLAPHAPQSPQHTQQQPQPSQSLLASQLLLSSRAPLTSSPVQRTQSSLPTPSSRSPRPTKSSCAPRSRAGTRATSPRHTACPDSDVVGCGNLLAELDAHVDERADAGTDAYASTQIDQAGVRAGAGTDASDDVYVDAHAATAAIPMSSSRTLTQSVTQSVAHSAGIGMGTSVGTSPLRARSRMRPSPASVGNLPVGSVVALTTTNVTTCVTTTVTTKTTMHVVSPSCSPPSPVTPLPHNTHTTHAPHTHLPLRRWVRRSRPACLTALAPESIVHVHQGPMHAFATSAGGRVLAWGSASHGRLADSAPAHVRSTVLVPRYVTPLMTLSVAWAACGWSHSLFGLSDGSLYAVGCGLSGRLGNGTVFDTNSPTKVAVPTDKPIVCAAAGYAHSVCVDAGGNAYTWGANELGQLGTGDRKHRLVPQRVSFAFAHRFRARERDREIDKLRECDGGQERGRAARHLTRNGRGRTQDSFVDREDAPHIIHVCTGPFHTMAVCASGGLYVWGANKHYQLGLGVSTAPATARSVLLEGGSRVSGGAYTTNGGAVGDITFPTHTPNASTTPELSLLTPVSDAHHAVNTAASPSPLLPAADGGSALTLPTAVPSLEGLEVVALSCAATYTVCVTRQLFAFSNDHVPVPARPQRLTPARQQKRGKTPATAAAGAPMAGGVAAGVGYGVGVESVRGAHEWTETPTMRRTGLSSPVATSPTHAVVGDTPTPTSHHALPFSTPSLHTTAHTDVYTPAELSSLALPSPCELRVPTGGKLLRHVLASLTDPNDAEPLSEVVLGVCDASELPLRRSDGTTTTSAAVTAPATTADVVAGGAGDSVMDGMSGGDVASDEVLLPGLVDGFRSHAHAPAVITMAGAIGAAPGDDVATQHTLHSGPRDGVSASDSVDAAGAWDVASSPGQGKKSISASGARSLGLLSPAVPSLTGRLASPLLDRATTGAGTSAAAAAGAFGSSSVSPVPLAGLGGLASTELKQVTALYHEKLTRDAHQKAQAQQQHLRSQRENERERRKLAKEEEKREQRVLALESKWIDKVLKPILHDFDVDQLVRRSNSGGERAGDKTDGLNIGSGGGMLTRSASIVSPHTHLNNRIKHEAEKQTKDKNASSAGPPALYPLCDPSWVDAAPDVRHDPRCKQPWQRAQKYVAEDGVPVRLRRIVWPLAAGNAEDISYDYYLSLRAKTVVCRKHYSASKSAAKRQVPFPVDAHIVDAYLHTCFSDIDVDLTRTFPHLAFYQAGSQLKASMRDVLDAFCFHHRQVGYVQGLSYLCGKLLLFMDDYAAFTCLVNMCASRFMLAALKMDPVLLQARYDLFLALLKDNASSIYRHLHGIDILACGQSLFFLDWIMTLFSKRLEIDLASRIWDLYLLQGEQAVYRCGVALFLCLENQLLGKSFEEVHATLTNANTMRGVTEEAFMAALRPVHWGSKHEQMLTKLLALPIMGVDDRERDGADDGGAI